ncbi:uncharacterized protein [Montipora foliosa]|uniref:uncharacterized protein isoform X4 n=1 Tax=Montipora foliosa TaxID=591990 RepID=UPI0035F162EF
MHSCLPGKKMPSCNKTVEKRFEKEKEEGYYERLQNVKPFLDITPPKEHQHLQLSVKKMQMQQERQAAIDRQNQVILSALMKIKQSPARVDNWNKEWKPSDDRLKRFRDRRERRISLENEKQRDRLKKIRPYYDVQKWEQDFKKHQYYLSMLDGGTKDYDEIEDEDEEEEDESDDERLPSVESPVPEKKDAKKKKEDQVKLPPIESKKKKDTNGNKKNDYPEHVVIMDAENINRAIKENDKGSILEVLGRVSEKKKLDKLKAKYKELYDKDLMEEVKPKIDEEMQEALDSLHSGAEEDAKQLYEAMKGLGTDEDILIDILCTRSNAELRDVRAAYSRKYDSTLEEDLKGDTSGDLETLLVELSKGQRDDSTEVDKELAKADAKDIMEAGVASWGTDEGKFISIFTQRSRPQLGATFPEYKKLTKKDIADSIDSEMEGDLQRAFLTLVKCVRDPTGFHSEKLHKALQDGDTKTVARIVLSKDKAQLNELAAAYKKVHKVELADEIDKKCSGDLKTAILAKFAKKGKEAKAKKQQKPVEKPAEKTKNDAAKGKPKPKPTAAPTKDKNAEKKRKEQEAAAEKDADELAKAVEAEDKPRIVDMLAKNCSDKSKLKKLQEKYRKKQNKDLLEALKPILDEDLQKAVESLLMESAVHDAKSLYYAMKDLGTDEDVLIEILCTRSNSQIKEINSAYSKMYESSLESDLKGDTSGDFEALLVELSKGQRDESTKVDKEMAKNDAKELHEAGSANWGTDEGKFIRIFTLRSRPQLGATFPEYKKLTNKDIADSIDAEMDGDMQKAFMTLVKCSRDPVSFRLEKLQRALTEEDTKAVATIILPKNKTQIDELAAAFQRANKVDLAGEVDKKCEGDLKTLILAKLGRVPDATGKQQKGTGTNQPKSDGEVTDQENNAPSKPAVEDPKALMEKDLDELRKAIDDGDKDKVVDILARHCDEKSKLKDFKEKYREKHGQDLLEAVKPVLDEEQLQDAVESLFMEAALYDARLLYNAMKGLGTDEDILIEILCARTNDEMDAIRKTYADQFGRSLEKDIKGDTSGDFEDLLVELTKGKRDESSKVDRSLAKTDAEALMQAGYLGTDKSKFTEVFTQRSFAHLKVMFQEYKRISNQEMETTIEEEMSHDMEKGFSVLVKYSRDPARFYAAKLHSSLEKEDTDTAGRIILTSTTDELADFVAGYKSLYKKDLRIDAEAKFSENLKKLILPRLKKGAEKQKEKEKAGNASKRSLKQGSSPGKKTDPKSSVNKRSSKTVKKGPPQVDNMDYSELRNAIDAENKKKIKGIVCRNLENRDKAKKLVDDYNSRYQKELFESLDEKLDDDLLEALAAFSLPKAQYDARTLNLAMKGFFTKELILLEMFSIRTNAEIAGIRQAYKKKYRKDLIEVIKDETSGDFQTLLVELCKGQREEGEEINSDLAHKDAESLLEAGIKKWGTDEETFIEIFTTRSFAQLRAMLPEYKEWAKCEMEDTINSEMSGDLCEGLQILLKCVRNKNQFLADKLQEALRDKDTKTATRRILGESNIEEIEKTYNAAYKPKLATEVDKNCSNELKKVLLPKLKDTGSDDEKSKDEKPSPQKPSESKPDEKPVEDKVVPDQNSEEAGKPRENDKGSENQDEEKRDEERPQLSTEKPEYHGTLKPAENFNPTEDAETLKNAMKGFGSDEDAIVAVLGSRTHEQRQEIAAKFQQEYDKNLTEELKSDLGGKFEDAIVALMSSPELYDANSLRDAMSGLGTNEAVLIEILCSRSSEEIQAIKSVFKKVHGRDLIDEIESETSGDLQTTLIKLAQATRSNSKKVDENRAYEDAKKLFEAGEKEKWGTNESVFVNILTSRSLSQLNATFEAYKYVAKKDIMDSINEELTGDFHDSIEAIVRCTRNAPLYFAEVLENALGGISADTKDVIRVVITRSEVDLAEIKTEYQKKTGVTLKQVIEDQMKGDIEKLLLQIVGD